ncbi:MAG: Nramp family divalent metal transporter [Proteobacteria bacterium]|nr:Nramp family divalent metal transporter [Pseudomonadota bacterium]
MKKLRAFISVLGPGILWATVAIGETHLALLPYAGALFGMSVLWAVLLVHVLYYPNFEYGPRYAVATGDSLLDGYGRTRLGKGVYWFFLVLMFVTPPLLMASLLGMTGSALYAGIPSVGFEWWCLVVFLLTLAVVVSRRYKVVERIAKLLTMVIVVIAIFAFATSPPSPGAAARGLVPDIMLSSAFMLVLVAVLRMPTDPTISIFLSKWAQEKRSEWGDAPEERLSALKKSLTDIRTGFAISFLVALVFLSMGAVVLKPRGVVPEGIDVSVRLAEIYTASFGAWIFPVFILAALAAFWGTYISAMDGMLRLFGNLIERLFNPRPRSVRIAETVYVVLVALVGLLMATVIKRPVALVLLAVSMGLLYYPLIFGLNIHCVTRQVEPAFRPGKLNLAVAFCGLFLGISALVLLILVRVVKVFG